MDIAKHNNARILARVPLFSGCSDQFCRELSLSLKPEFFLSGADIIEEGEIGEEMFFQSSGKTIVIKRRVKVDTMCDTNAATANPLLLLLLLLLRR
jgi:hypothetical protein